MKIKDNRREYNNKDYDDNYKRNSNQKDDKNYKKQKKSIKILCKNNVFFIKINTFLCNNYSYII